MARKKTSSPTACVVSCASVWYRRTLWAIGYLSKDQIVISLACTQTSCEELCGCLCYLSAGESSLLQPLPIANQAWKTVCMDFIEGLPKSHKFDTILVVVDKFTKYGHFLPLAHPFTAK